MRKIIFLILLAIEFTSLKAQMKGLTVHADRRVDSLVAFHLKHNQAYPVILGFRIQIYKDSGNDALNKARKMVEKFKKNFPNLPAYISFNEPYYRVRVGNFRSRLEALKAMEDIKRKYRNVWVTKDNIYFEDQSIEPLNTDNYE